MRRKLMAQLVLVSLAVSCAVTVSAQLGGYRQIDKADDGAVTAADFAVKAQSEKQEMSYKLVSIEKVESQSAAGTNYRMCLKIGYHKNDDDVDTTEFVKVVVHRNLQGQHSLISWTEENCGDDGE
jgi:hypothetical protein